MNENAREVEMDMREMVAKVKKGEPLYGHSTLTPHMQGVAARNSRYSSLWTHIMPWANFTNHNQVCQSPSDSRTAWLTVSSMVLIQQNTTSKRSGNWRLRRLVDELMICGGGGFCLVREEHLQMHATYVYLTISDE
jgi:hypothetical protein